MANRTSDFKSLSTKKIRGLALRRASSLQPDEGFTLVELLIVIALISVMAAVPIMGSYLKSQQRARDAVRRNDISEIGNALEQYYSVCKDISQGYSYPATGSYATILASGGSISCTNPAVTFMSKVPQDPKSGSGSYYCGVGLTCDNTQYTICATLEAETAPAPTGFCLSNRQ